MKYLSSPLGPVIWAALLFGIMLLWLYPLMGWVLDASFRAGSGAKPMLLAGSMIVAASSLVLGSVLRWLAAAATKAAPLVGAAFAGPMLGGWVSVASPDLRGALSLQLNGLAPFYLLYLGTWIATLAYLMKVPWDRVTELGRDKLLGKEPDAETGLSVGAGGPLTDFPASAFILVSIAGLATFCVLIGAGVTVSGVGQWLLKPPDNLVVLIGSAGLVFTARQWRADPRAKQAPVHYPNTDSQ